MESGDEAVAYLAAHGFHAQGWDCYAPGAIAVASGILDSGDGVRILKHMVVVAPREGRWSIHSEFPVTVERASLAEAVEAAMALVSEMRESGFPRRFLAKGEGRESN